jgi:hypothetical protein
MADKDPTDVPADAPAAALPPASEALGAPLAMTAHFAADAADVAVDAEAAAADAPASSGSEDGAGATIDDDAGASESTAAALALARVKSGAIAAVSTGQRLTRSGWANFRARPLYFQYRVALVAAWVVVSGLTLAIAPPTPKDFLVERRDLSFGLANRTALLIVNQNSGNRDACVLEVTGVDVDFDGKSLGPGTWRTKPFKLRQGDKKTISTEEFFDDKERNPGYQLEVTRARLLEDDDVLWSGTPTRPGAATKASSSSSSP